MSNAINNLLTKAAQLHGNDDPTWLEQLVQKEVNAALANGSWATAGTGDRLVDIGEFLVHAGSLLSRVADGVTHGRHIEAYAKSKIEGMKSENDLSELNPLYDMDEKHRSLTAMAARLKKTSIDIAGIWNGTQTLDVPINLSGPRNLSEAGASVAGLSRTPQLEEEESWMSLTNQGEPSHYGNYSDPLSSAEASGAESENMTHGPARDQSSSLLKRCKGRYQCPEWRTCTKGGAKDGCPIIFERHSAIRAHIAKHKRPYKCGEAGCGKTFGRPDHLKRHRQKERESFTE